MGTSERNEDWFFSGYRMTSLIGFLIRWQIISRRHPRAGRIYFWAFLLTPVFFVLAVIAAYYYDQSGQNQLQLAFYALVALGILGVILIFLIEVYAFLSFVKRIFR